MRESEAPFREWLRNEGRRWAWLCPLLAIVLAVAVLVVFGVTVWSAIITALLLVCPALLLWGAFHLSKQ